MFTLSGAISEHPKERDKTPTRRKLKKSRSPPVVSPLFHDGVCQRCKCTNYLKESIKCNVCESQFHTACRGKSGSQLNDSICSRTFRDSFTSVSNKGGHPKFSQEGCRGDFGTQEGCNHH